MGFFFLEFLEQKLKLTFMNRNINVIKMSKSGTVVCLLCRGMISFKSGDKARFESHLQHEHEAYFGLDILLAISFIREEERRAIVR